MPDFRREVTFSKARTRELFQVVSKQFFDALDGYGGYLALGCMLAYPAGCGFYHRYKGYGGLWLHGGSLRDRNAVARWLLRVEGVNCWSGMPLPTARRHRLYCELRQRIHRPFWVDDYRPDCPAWVEAQLKRVFKPNFAGIIVTSQAPSPYADLRSRYCHVLIPADDRVLSRADWFEKTSGQLCFLGRYALWNRYELTSWALVKMDDWMKPFLGLNCRYAAIAHGTAYSAFCSMVRLLGSHDNYDLCRFRAFTKACVTDGGLEVSVPPIVDGIPEVFPI